MVRNVSSIHGLRSRYELTLAVQQAMQIKTGICWANGLALTVRRKPMRGRFFSNFWQLGKVKMDMEFKIIGCVREMAMKSRWPWQDNHDEPRSIVDV